MYKYRHPRPAVSVDIVLFQILPQGTNILLIRRARAPFQGYYALPGGFVNIDEPLEAAARRELKEETGLDAADLHQIHTFGAPDRDPRGRVISVAYAGTLGAEIETEPKAASDADRAGWFDIHKLPPLAFDHQQIIQKALQSMGLTD